MVLVEQAGILSIILYEDKDITFNFVDDDTAQGILNTGQVITLENCDLPKFEFEIVRNANNVQAYEYQIEFTKYKLDLQVLDDIAAIRESIYGFKAVINYYNGKSHFINSPLRLNEETDLDSQASHHFEITLNNEIPTEQRLLNFQEVEPDQPLFINDTDNLLINATDKLLIS